jgi:ankyrin repeat protein
MSAPQTDETLQTLAENFENPSKPLVASGSRKRGMLTGIFGLAAAGIIGAGLWASNDQRLQEGVDHNQGWKTEMALQLGVNDRDILKSAVQSAFVNGDQALALQLLDHENLTNQDAVSMLNDSIEDGQNEWAQFLLTQNIHSFSETDMARVYSSALVMGAFDVAVSAASNMNSDERLIARTAYANLSAQDAVSLHSAMPQAQYNAVLSGLFDMLYEQTINPQASVRVQDGFLWGMSVGAAINYQTAQQNFVHMLVAQSAQDSSFPYNFISDLSSSNEMLKAHYFLQTVGDSFNARQTLTLALDEGQSEITMLLINRYPEVAQATMAHAALSLSRLEDVAQNAAQIELLQNRITNLESGGVELNHVLATHAFNPFFVSALPVLVNAGADVQVALDVAASNNDLEGVRVLMQDLGADITADDYRAVKAAVNENAIFVLQEALEWDSAHNQSQMINTICDVLLVDAIYDGNERAANILIEHNAHYLLQNWQVTNIGEIAATQGYPDVFEAMVDDRGLALTLRSPTQVYALYYIQAAENGHMDILQKNLAEGVNIDSWGGQAVIRAARNGHLDIVQYLSEQRANLTFRNGEAFFAAVAGGNMEMADYISTAAPQVLSMRDNTALSYAYNAANKPMFELLLSKGVVDFADAMNRIIADDNLEYAALVFDYFAQSESASLPVGALYALNHTSSDEMRALAQTYPQESWMPQNIISQSDFINGATPQPIGPAPAPVAPQP